MPIYSFTALNHGAPRRTPWREFGLFEDYIEIFLFFRSADFVDPCNVVPGCITMRFLLLPPIRTQLGFYLLYAVPWVYIAKHGILN